MSRSAKATRVLLPRGADGAEQDRPRVVSDGTEVREEDAGDGFPPVPAPEIRFAEARRKGFLHYARPVGQAGIHVDENENERLSGASSAFDLEVQQLEEVRLVMEIDAAPVDVCIFGLHPVLPHRGSAATCFPGNTGEGH